MLALLELFDGELSPISFQKYLFLFMQECSFESDYETVCTAGFREDGSWVRIFPVPHRLMRLQEEKAYTYSKWQWIEVDLMHRPEKDDRPESFRIKNIDTLKLGAKISTKANGWSRRWDYVKKNKAIYTNMSDLIQLAKDNKLSLAIGY